MKKLRVLIALLTVALAPFALSAQKALTVEQVTSKLDENFKGISTYRAKFEQEVKSEQFAKTLSEGSGELFYSKPGKMAWQYGNPEEHLYVTDGKVFWDYLPSAKQAMKMNIDEALASGLPKTFLFGMGRLADQFAISFAGDQAETDPAVYHLVLTPKKDEDKTVIGTLELFVDAKSFLVTQADLKDAMGNENSLRFSDIKVNPAIAAGTFVFTPPKGVEVIKPQETLAPKGAPAKKSAPSAGTSKTNTQKGAIKK